MPVIAEGPLAGNYRPDYDGGSTINLLASIIAARGGRSPHAPLRGLAADLLTDAHAVLYLVLDGLGSAQLERHLQAGGGRRFFAAHPHRSISSVFPATTAAAVTTFDTGASPAEHGVLSWYLHLPDLGCVATVLRTTTRAGTPLVAPKFDLAEYFAVPSYVATTTAHRGLLSFGDIPDVPFAAVGTVWDDRRSYVDLEGLVRTVGTFVREPGRRLAYVYWPRYDGLCHEVGCDHADVAAHFEALDRMLAHLVEHLAGSQTVLCVLADHGLVDVAPARCIDLAEVPGLMACLATAPAGDQRQVSCFVRPAKVAEFLRICRETLGEVCVCVPGEHLLELGAFGPGELHRDLRARLGDYVLVCKEGHSLIHTPRGLRRLYMPGSHGGMSSAEIAVPLYTVQCP